MTGLKQRIFRRRAPGSPRRSAAGFVPRLTAGLSRLRPGGRKRTPWGKKAEQAALPAGAPPAPGLFDQPAAQPQPGLFDQPAVPPAQATAPAEIVETAPGAASFRDRGRLRRRLRFLRRARELAFRDVGGLLFDMRRFGRDRPDLVEAKLAALGAVDQELRALERVLDDRRPIHELREPGLSSCPRCGALHASEDNFCPRCGLQFTGAVAMGEVGGAIAAPPQPPPAPVTQATSPTLFAPIPAPSPVPAPTPARTTAPASADGAGGDDGAGHGTAAGDDAGRGAASGDDAGRGAATGDDAAADDGAVDNGAAAAPPARDIRDQAPAVEQQTEIYRPHDAS